VRLKAVLLTWDFCIMAIQKEMDKITDTKCRELGFAIILRMRSDPGQKNGDKALGLGWDRR
jgi:hypothetical protein